MASAEIPDWMRCVNCKARARRGVIIHYPTCPEYVRNPKVTGTAEPRSTDSHRSPGDAWSTIVGKLTPARRRDRFVCPSCGDERHGGLKVEIGDAGGILLWCFGCCTPGDRAQQYAAQTEILTSLGLDWSAVQAGSRRSPPSRGISDTLRSPAGGRRCAGKF
jgi:hypothetical protein